MNQIDAALDRADRAADEIARFADAQPKNAWKWSIPADEERDSDLLLLAPVDDVARLSAALKRVLRETEQQPVAHERVYQIIGEELR